MRLLLLLLVLVSLTLPRAQAQGERKAIQFSGVIVGGKNSEILPGAYVFLPRAGRGTLSNNVGFFTLPVFPGDSILFSYTGYERQYFVVPRNYREETFSAKIQLQEDAILLREVKVYPFRSRKEFDDAFLAMTLADARQRQALAENTDAAALRRLGVIQGNTPSANFRTSQQQLLNYANNKGFANTLNLLNPCLLYTSPSPRD